MRHLTKLPLVFLVESDLQLRNISCYSSFLHGVGLWKQQVVEVDLTTRKLKKKKTEEKNLVESLQVGTPGACLHTEEPWFEIHGTWLRAGSVFGACNSWQTWREWNVHWQHPNSSEVQEHQALSTSLKEQINLFTIHSLTLKNIQFISNQEKIEGNIFVGYPVGSASDWDFN